MGCMISFYRDIASVVKASSSGIVFNALGVAAPRVTMLVSMGYIGKGNLAAALLGLCYVDMVTSLLGGALTGVDAQVQAAIRDGKHGLARYWTFAGMLSASFLCCVGTWLMLVSFWVLPYISGANGHTTSKAVQFIVLSIPGYWVESLTGVLQRYSLTKGGALQEIKTLSRGLLLHVFLLGLSTQLLGLGFMSSYLATLLSRLAVAHTTWRRVFRDGRLRKEGTDLLRCFSAVIQRRLGLSLSIPTLVAVPSNEQEFTVDFTLDESELDDMELDNMRGSAEDSSIFEGVMGGAAMISPIHHNTAVGATSLMQEITPSEAGSLNSTMHGESGSGSGGESRSNGGSDARGDNNPMLALQEARVKELLAYCARLFFLGASGGGFVSVDTWFLIGTVFLSSFSGNVALCACGFVTILAQTFVQVGSMPLGNAMAMRVQALLRQGRPEDVSVMALAVTVLSPLPAAALAAVVYASQQVVPFLLTPDGDIRHRFTLFAESAAMFLFLYCTRGGLAAIVRGIYRFPECAGYTVLCDWVIGAGTGWYLCYQCRPRFGQRGLFIGLSLGSLMMLLCLASSVLSVVWKDEERRTMHLQRRARDDPDSMPLLAAPWALSVGAIPLSAVLRYSDERAAMDELEFIEYGHGQYSGVSSTEMPTSEEYSDDDGDTPSVPMLDHM